MLEKLEIVNADKQPIYTIDPDASFVQIVYNLPDGQQLMAVTNTGSLTLWGEGDKHRVRLDGSLALAMVGGNHMAGTIQLRDKGDKIAIQANADGAGLRIGMQDNAGDLAVRDGQDRVFFHVNDTGLRVGVAGNAGDVTVRDGYGEVAIHLDGQDRTLRIGGATKAGELVVNDGMGLPLFQVDHTGLRIGVAGHGWTAGHAGDVTVRDGNGNVAIHLDGQDRALRIGGATTAGDLVVNDGMGLPLFQVDHTGLRIGVAGHGGAAGHAGNITVRDGDGTVAIHLDGQDRALRIGGAATPGDLVVNDETGLPLFQVNHTGLRIGVAGHGGTPGHAGDVTVRDGDGKVTIQLDGSKGDIVLSNADFAEDFDIAGICGIEPGTVVVLRADGAVEPSTKSYDKRVAGVVSGARGYKPALVLDRHPSAQTRQPLALVGKVYCKVDATAGAVEVGDLLTTSSTVGHAMKALDQSRAFGAVLGKALAPLRDGLGMIPVLIALQ